MVKAPFNCRHVVLAWGMGQRMPLFSFDSYPITFPGQMAEKDLKAVNFEIRDLSPSAAILFSDEVRTLIFNISFSHNVH